MDKFRSNVDIINRGMLQAGILLRGAIVVKGDNEEKCRQLVATLAGFDLDTYMHFVQVLENLGMRKLVNLFVDAAKEKSWFEKLSK